MTYTTKEFVVKVAASKDDEWVLTESELYARLTESVGYSGLCWIESVKRLVPPGKVFPGKIQAIKEIRSLLRLSLKDSKHMVDAATVMGEFELMLVTVTYNRDTGNYTITDAR